MDSFVGAIGIYGSTEVAPFGVFAGVVKGVSDGDVVGATDIDGDIEGFSGGGFVGAFDMNASIEGLIEGSSVGNIDVVGIKDLVGNKYLVPVNSIISVD